MALNEASQLQEKQYFKPLPPGNGFPFNYQPSRLDRNALFALNQVFDKEKIGQVRTKYHRAKLNIDDLRSDLLEYSCPKVNRLQDDAYYMIFESVDKDIFGDIKVIPLTHGAVAANPDLPRQKSPGIPLKVQGFATKGEAIDDPNVLNNIRKTWYAIERNEDVTLPDVACYARAQICSREKNKVRATWGYPLTVFLTEAQTFYPLLHELKNRDKPKVAYGVEIGTGGMNFINDMVSHFPKHNYLVGDWTRFDKTVPAWLIRDAFKMVLRHLDLTQVRSVDGALWPVRPSKSRKRFNAIVKYFIDTPVQLSNGERFIKHGGIPSGSCYTNLIDGIVNAIVTRYLIYSMTGALPLDDLYLGDDIIAITDKPLNLDVFSDLAKKKFSMVFNPDKSYQTSNKTNVHFLGYYNIHGVPYKPVDTVIASSVYPERPVLSKFETITRMIGQAYSCFEPEDAKKFFMAAQILQEEMPGLTSKMIEDFSSDHSHWFKYLRTIGVTTQGGLKIPKVTKHDLVWITAPQAPRRKWKPTVHNLQELAETAYRKWTLKEEEGSNEEENTSELSV